MKTIAFITPGLIALLIAGCATSQSTVETVPASSNVLRVGVTPTMPPMIFKQGGAIVGIEADLANQLAASLNKTVRFVEIPWSKQMDALLEGRIDIIMSNMSMTPARAMRVEFTRPYMKSGQMALVRGSEASALQIGMYSAGRRVGVQEATTGDYFVQQQLTRAKRNTFPDAKAGAAALLDNRIDVFVHDAPVNWWLASENEARGLIVMPGMLTEEFLAWAVRKDNTALRDSANQFLEQSFQSGQLAKTIRRWVPGWN